MASRSRSDGRGTWWTSGDAARPTPAWRSPRATALLAAAVGPTVLVARTGPTELALRVALLWALASTAILLWSARRSGWALGFAAVGTVWAVLTAADERMPVVLVLLGVVAVAVTSGLAPPPASDGDRRPFGRLPFAIVAGAQLALVRGSTGVAAGLLVVALAGATLYRARPRTAAAGDAAMMSAVRAATRLVAMVVVLVVALPTLYLPGAIVELWSRRRSVGPRSSNWSVRSASAEQIRRDQMWPFASTAADVRRRRLRIGIAVTGVCAVALVALVASGAFDRDEVPSGRVIEFGSFAFPDEPWVDELYEAGFDVTFHPSLGWQSTEVDSRYLQVRDGVRRSWTPADPELTVWFLGGSAMWGLGQRDEHTIASQIARLADAEGMRVRAVNLAVPGYNQWQEIASMGIRLSRGERPDLIVMYDGANDLTSMLYRGGEGMVELDVPPNRFHEQIESATNFSPEPRGEPAEPPQVVEAFESVYGAGVDLARRTAGAYGVPIVIYFQPQYLSTQPSAVDAPLLASFPELRPGVSDAERETIARVREQLPAGVVDLGSALDGVDSPTWFDPVHTNELGAAIVAEQMWTTLGPELTTLAGPTG